MGSRLNGRVQRPKTEKMPFISYYYTIVGLWSKAERKKKSSKMSQTQWKYCVALWKHESAVINLISRLNGRVQRPKTEKNALYFLLLHYSRAMVGGRIKKKVVQNVPNSVEILCSIVEA